MSQKQRVQQIYKKVTQIQHVLLRPDTYVGSISSIQDYMWILNDNQIIYDKIKYVPGLYKIFDQVLVNAADNYQRDNKMTQISVTIQKNGIITIENDGKSIPVQIHKQHKIYVAELIFGHLLTSSNYQDKKKKITGGRNGYGAKLANIFSKYFYVQTADSTGKKMLKIQWKNNMSQMKQPQILPYSFGKDYTKISFLPDYQRFGMKSLSRQMLALLKKRVYDMSGILKVNVQLNSKKINIKNFKQYVLLYVNDKNDLIFDQTIISKRWSVMITKSQGQFQQVSFVNGICTIKGGTHVNHIMDQIVEKLLPNLKKKAKDIQIKPFQIKNQMRIFINCLIQNPSFDSQTKQTLTTTASNFGSLFDVTDKMIKQIQKSGICDQILNTLRNKQNSKIDKHLKKIQNNKFVIPKLQDANLAGKSDKCTLILTQGDSAKTLAMSGIEKLKRDFYGVFPLKGKVVNVRDMTIKQIMDNDELSNIVKILGLSFGKQYHNTENLRYSSVMIMADQDIDGSHIKGLIINFFQTFWPSLCKIRGFLKQFITPIIRCKKNNEVIDFFSQTDYQSWRIDSGTEWKIKYYKGLGTSTHQQAKQYFSNLPKHQIQFKYQDQKDKQAIDLAFNKRLADQRKKWLQSYDIKVNIDYSIKTIKIQDFINKQFIHFSNYDNIRSIPSSIDGLKPSQRKILFACFKRNLRTQVKVAQLAGYVAEHSAYHHGQMSLTSTIISMAQNYVGSNNLNLLQPIGQFGTRYMNGKDNASARYIYTNLNPLTRYLFNQADDHVVQYIQQQNKHIQPKYYVPILPLILINGCEGIGTGWSTTVYPHKVDDVIQLIRRRMKRQTYVMKIGFEGYKGEIILEKENVFTIKGIYEIDDDVVEITEIPINKSIRDYKSFLEEKLDSIDNKQPDISDIRQYHTDGNVHFVVTFIQQRQPRDDWMQKYLKLSTTLQQNNMVLFDQCFKLKKFKNIYEIVQTFYQERIKTYKKRKEYLVSRFQRQYEILENKINFIKQVIDGKMKMMEKKQSWIQNLIKNKFKSFNQLTKTKSTKQLQYTFQSTQDITKNIPTTNNKDFNYLLSMPIWNFCKQKISQLQNTKSQVQSIIKYYRQITQIQLWQKDLDEFENVWKIYQKNRENLMEEQKQKKQIKIKNSLNNQLRMSKNKSQKKIESQNSIQEQEEDDINIKDKKKYSSRNDKNIQIKSKSTNKQQNLMQQQIQQDISSLEVSKKKLKIQKQKQPQPQPIRIKQPIDDNSIDSILNKYLITASTDGLSFEQRIKAKLASYQNNFALEVNKKVQLQEEVQNQQDKDNLDKQKKQEKEEKSKQMEPEVFKRYDDLKDYQWMLE